MNLFRAFGLGWGTIVFVLIAPLPGAGAVRFLVSPEGAFVSGANLPVTGGILFA